MVHTFRAVPEVVPHQRGKCDWLKPISERCNLSLFTAAERGVFDSRPDNTGEPLNSFVWLASIQACEPCPTQSAAIVTMRIRQQLCESLQCYMDIRSPSLFFRFCSPSLFTPSFFLCYNPLILCSMRTLFSVLRPSLPHFLLLFLSSWALCPIALCPPLLLCFYVIFSQTPGLLSLTSESFCSSYVWGSTNTDSKHESLLIRTRTAWRHKQKSSSS